MIKPTYSLFFSALLFSFSLHAGAEQITLTKEEIIQQLSTNDYVKTMFDLCEGNITIDSKILWDCAGISISTENEYDDFVEILSRLPIQKMVDLSARTNAKGDSLLHMLVRAEKIDFIKAFLLHSINIDPINNDGNTPLHFAAQQENIKIIKLLLQHGASEEIKNNTSQTPSNILKSDFFFIYRLQQAQETQTKSAIYDSWIQDLIRSPFAMAHTFNAHLNAHENENFIDKYYADENQVESDLDENADDLDESLEGY